MFRLRLPGLLASVFVLGAISLTLNLKTKKVPLKPKAKSFWYLLIASSYDSIYLDLNVMARGFNPGREGRDRQRSRCV